VFFYWEVENSCITFRSVMAVASDWELLVWSVAVAQVVGAGDEAQGSAGD
jgi:hypothetical protein